MSGAQRYATQRKIRRVFDLHNHKKAKRLGLNFYPVCTKISYGGISLRRILVWPKTFLVVLCNPENTIEKKVYLHTGFTELQVYDFKEGPL